MAKRYNGRWEGPIHFVEWMQFVFDEDYERGDMELDRLAVAWETMGINESTSISCLLNQWNRTESPAGWDAALAFYAANAWDNPYRFEADAVAFLESVVYLEPPKHGSLTTNVAALRDAQDEREVKRDSDSRDRTGG